MDWPGAGGPPLLQHLLLSLGQQHQHQLAAVTAPCSPASIWILVTPFGDPGTDTGGEINPGYNSAQLGDAVLMHFMILIRISGSFSRFSCLLLPWLLPGVSPQYKIPQHPKAHYFLSLPRWWKFYLPATLNFMELLTLFHPSLLLLAPSLSLIPSLPWEDEEV